MGYEHDFENAQSIIPSSIRFSCLDLQSQLLQPLHLQLQATVCLLHPNLAQAWNQLA